MKGKLQVVVGAQFGSEAKGHVVQRLTERAHREEGLVQVIRVAGPNAGHTGYDATGTSWALRQIPVAAVTDGPTVLGVGMGSEIDLPVLLDEFDRLRDAGLLRNKMVWVHEEATMITQDHKDTEFSMVGRIGSTGKGIGAARAQRIYRVPGMRLADNEDALRELQDRGVAIAKSDANPDIMISADNTIIEGTQGYGLGLRAGFYPQCTSSDCRAQDFIAMAGIAPWMYKEVEVWAVARMFPIRVAGNSGPLKDETSWDELGLPPEYTTVTKKMRRVGLPDWQLVHEAVRANGGAPTVRLALTMVDQMFGFTKDRNLWEPSVAESDVYSEMQAYFRQVEQETMAKIELVTTGPNTATFMREV